MENTTDKRRYSLFSKSLKSCVEPVIRPSLKQHGAATSKLLLEWENIVGKELASNCHPIKLSFARDKNLEGTLLVACEGPHALTLQHMQPVIIERIASYFGYRAVAKISIEQRPMQHRKPAPKPKAPKPVHVDTGCIDEVTDPDVREALSALANSFAKPTL